MVLGRAVGIGEDLTRAEHRAEDPAAHRHVTHVGGESVTEESGRLGLWRYRLRDFRIVCELQDARQVVLVVGIGHRKNIYE